MILQEFYQNQPLLNNSSEIESCNTGPVENDTTGILLESALANHARLNNSSEVESCNSGNSRDSQASAPTSITVSEGDLLQPS